MARRNLPGGGTFFFFSQAGCLLPSLVLFNLFFGWMFFKPAVWLSIEAALILLFVIGGYIMARRISRIFSGNNDVIDVKGEVVEDKDKLK